METRWCPKFELLLPRLEVTNRGDQDLGHGQRWTPRSASNGESTGATFDNISLNESWFEAVRGLLFRPGSQGEIIRQLREALDEFGDEVA